MTRSEQIDGTSSGKVSKVFNNGHCEVVETQISAKLQHHPSLYKVRSPLAIPVLPEAWKGRKTQRILYDH